MIYLCGCGAIGSRIALELSNDEDEWVLIDDDIVKIENLGTSAFYKEHLGVYKADALAELLWRKNKVMARPMIKELSSPVKPTLGSLVIDSFDNPKSRLLTVSQENTIHLGVGTGETGAAIWDIDWTKPSIDFDRGNNPVCTHDLGDLIILSTVAIGAYSIKKFWLENKKESYFLNGCTKAIKL